MRSLLVNEGGVHPSRLVSVLSFDGSPITARFITEAVGEKMKSGTAMVSERAK